MGFKYSTFISYRHENERNKFIEKFCEKFNPHADDATGQRELFLDKNEFQGSQDLQLIYEAIRNSYFFSVFHTDFYLHESNPWCAKELKYALDVEECRRKKLDKKDREKFYILNLFLVSGTENDLPEEIKNRNALNIAQFQYSISSKSKNLFNFFDGVRKFMREVKRIYEKYPHIDFISSCEKIPLPTDEEIVEWIRKQKKIITANEAKHEPRYKNRG